MSVFRSVCALAAAAVVLQASTASAAVIAGYSFGTNAAQTLAPTTVAPNVTASNFTPAAGTTGGSFETLTSYYVGADVPLRAINRTTGGSSPAVGVQSGFYADITVTAASGYELDLSNFTFRGGAGGGTANQRGYAIYTSVNGLGLADNTNIASGDEVTAGTFSAVRNTGAAMQLVDGDLSSPAYQNLSAITVRVYFSTLNQAQNVDTDSYTLNGTVSEVAAVPEPAALAAIAGVALVGLRRRRRGA